MKALLALVLAACASTQSAPAARAKAERVEAPEPPLDARDQYALAREMLHARTLDDTARAAASARTESEWSGRRVRWQMMRVDALCRETCLFAPFDHARLADNDLSFLARADFADGERTRLDELCSPHAPRCVAELEGSVELVFDATETRLSLTGVRVIDARRRHESEHFMSRPEPELSNEEFRSAFTRGLLALDERSHAGAQR
jgi:hypothetical protein